VDITVPLKKYHSAAPPALKLNEALGQSEDFLEFQQRLSRVAPIERPVLIVGERGTGKELAAARLHFLSRRWQGPLVALNCAVLNPSLIESELFGHEKGAYSGADRQRRGRFESADGGTLFLDEIGAIPLEAQAKILRAVEYGTFERVGSSKSIEVDVRIIAATNADLPALAREGRFKQDLLDRLSFEVLVLPPLRERSGDIMLLAEHFASRMALEIGRTEAPRFSAQAEAALKAHPWPGNIRELKNLIERTVYRMESGIIREIEFDPFTSRAGEKQPPGNGEPAVPAPRALPDGLLGMGMDAAVRELKIRMLREALAAARFNQRNAAQRLGLTYDQFRGLYRKYKENLADPAPFGKN
jgi:psp operon transcriptional activator